MKVKARHLRDDFDTRLGDGALVWRLSFQREWIYAKVVKAGKISRRRYRWDQMVEVEGDDAE